MAGKENNYDTAIQRTAQTNRRRRNNPSADTADPNSQTAAGTGTVLTVPEIIVLSE